MLVTIIIASVLTANIIVLCRLVVGTVRIGRLHAIIYAASYKLAPIALGSITTVGVLIVPGIRFACYARSLALMKLFAFPSCRARRRWETLSTAGGYTGNNVQSEKKGMRSSKSLIRTIDIDFDQNRGRM